MSSLIMNSGQSKAATLNQDPNRPQLNYAVLRIALRTRISTAQASVIAELLGISVEIRDAATIVGGHAR